MNDTEFVKQLEKDYVEGFCSPLTEHQLELTFYFMSVPTICIIAVLNCLKIHENHKPKAISPIDMYNPTNRFMYLVALGSTSSIMVLLVKEAEIFGWQHHIPHELGVFVSLLICVYFGFLFSPIFIAINVGTKLSYLLGWMYSATFGVIINLKTMPCAATTRSIMMGHWQTLPSGICSLLTSLGFLILLALACRKKGQKTVISLKLPAVTYRYPLPLLLGVFMAIQMIYQCTVMLTAKVDPCVNWLYLKIYTFGGTIVSAFVLGLANETGINTTVVAEMEYWVTSSKTTCYTSLALGFVTSVSGILYSLKKYSIHIRQVAKGIYTDIPKMHSPAHIITDSCKYVGFQIGYGCWGFILQAVVYLLCCATLTIMIIFWHRYNWNGILVFILNFLWPMILPMVVLIIIQRLLITLVFVAKIDDKYVSAIRYHNFFCNVQYYTIFLNAAVGLFACIVRIFLAMVFGLFALPTLDMSTMARPFEHFDEGFLSYVAMLQMENMQSNPMLRHFITVLLELNAAGKGLKRRYPHRNKWLLAITLHNNSGLSRCRKQSNKQKRFEETHHSQTKL